MEELLKNTDAQKVRIVFISACHSEKIGKMFKRYGVPVVIAINKSMEVLDDAAQKFAQGFYDSLMSMQSPEKAFNQGIKTIKAQSGDKFTHCCCHSHRHHENCLWQRKNSIAVTSEMSREEVDIAKR